MTLPTYQECMRPILEYAKTKPNGFYLKDPIEFVAKKFNLSESETTMMLSSGSKGILENRVAWAISYLSKANLLKRVSKANYILTDSGDNFLKNKKEINRKELEKIPEFYDWFKKYKVKKLDKETINQSELTLQNYTPEELIKNNFDEINNALKKELLDTIISQTPRFFERLILNLLVAMGYGGSLKESAIHSGKTGDHGIDGIIKEDRLGLDIICLQAKKYNHDNVIGEPQIRDFAGSLDIHSVTKGIFITTSYFSDSAYKFAEKISKRIILIDGEELANLLIKYNVGVRTEFSYEIKKVDLGYFEE